MWKQHWHVKWRTIILIHSRCRSRMNVDIVNNVELSKRSLFLYYCQLAKAEAQQYKINFTNAFMYRWTLSEMWATSSPQLSPLACVSFNTCSLMLSRVKFEINEHFVQYIFRRMWTGFEFNAWYLQRIPATFQCHQCNHTCHSTLCRSYKTPLRYFFNSDFISISVFLTSTWWNSKVKLWCDGRTKHCRSCIAKCFSRNDLAMCQKLPPSVYRCSTKWTCIEFHSLTFQLLENLITLNTLYSQNGCMIFGNVS